MPDDISITLAFTRHDVRVFMFGLMVGAIIGWSLGLFVGSSGRGHDSQW
jgi:uncharacterized membrane protein YccC